MASQDEKNSQLSVENQSVENQSVDNQSVDNQSVDKQKQVNVGAGTSQRHDSESANVVSSTDTDTNASDSDQPTCAKKLKYDTSRSSKRLFQHVRLFHIWYISM